MDEQDTERRKVQLSATMRGTSEDGTNEPKKPENSEVDDGQE